MQIAGSTAPYAFAAPLLSFTPACVINSFLAEVEVDVLLQMPAIDRKQWDTTQTMASSVVFLQPCAQLQWSGAILLPQEYRISKSTGVEGVPFEVLNPERDTMPWHLNPRLQSIEMEHKLTTCKGENCWRRSNVYPPPIGAKLDHVYDTHPKTACDDEKSKANPSPAKQIPGDSEVEVQQNKEAMLMESACKAHCKAGKGCKAAT